MEQPLSHQECKVIELIAKGMTTKQAARYLGVTPWTIDGQLENARRKTRTKTRAHLVAKAIQLGLIWSEEDG